MDKRWKQIKFFLVLEKKINYTNKLISTLEVNIKNMYRYLWSPNKLLSKLVLWTIKPNIINYDHLGHYIGQHIIIQEDVTVCG